MRLDDKFALVTGASSGIGEATARALAGHGAGVALIARSADRLARVGQEIAAAGGKALAFPAGLADPDQAARACEAAIAEAGAPDILVNNAGAGRWLSTIETSFAEARAMIELPYLAAFAVTRALLPAMLERGGGQIVNVASPASYMAWPNAAAYIAARQALKGFSDALRLEVAPRGLLVSLVVLGTVESAYWEHNPGSRERVPNGFAPLGADQAAQTIPRAIDKRRRYVVRPALFRLLFAMEAIAPGITAQG